MPITSLLVNLLASPKKPKITPCLQDKTQVGGLVRRTIQVQRAPAAFAVGRWKVVGCNSSETDEHENAQSTELPEFGHALI